ncbi:hypothetical protein GTV32_03960 [Gordonia sp. SID5947]|uniref:DUF5995 family protein n=1 Tax=Gordonia sp. SID5947 TaxID=2690315 RepID=UPI001368EB54|nr:DUF5995 family protein [Gordonia sp. SID5947]MYR05520.1 hypothetical protein [Gordonia sp. SID5947]
MTALRPLVLAIALTAVALGSGAPVVDAAPRTGCATTLSSADVDRIVHEADIGQDRDRPILASLRNHVARLWAITDILVAHGDDRGLFPLALAVTERDAVMPLQNRPSSFQHPGWAPGISQHLLDRFLDAIHAEFTAGRVPPQWQRYFSLARDCTASGERITTVGFNAHITVDLAYATSDARTTQAEARDFFLIVDTIAAHGNSIVRATNRAYGIDLGPAFRFYFVGEGLDRLVGAGRATGPMLRAADVGYNVLTFGNGLALQNPATRAGAVADVNALWTTGDTALAAFEQVGLP